jgi:hypothetical protein
MSADVKAFTIVGMYGEGKSVEEIASSLDVPITFVRGVIKARVVSGSLVVVPPVTTPPVLTVSVVLTPDQQGMKSKTEGDK